MNKPQTLKREDRWFGISNIRLIGMILAGYILAILILQLFTFENFPGLLEGLGLSEAGSKVVVIVLVVLEALALPFWLGIEVVKPLRNVSMVSGALALAMLLVTELIAFTLGQTVVFGATIDIPAGLWSVLLLVAIWVLEIWILLGTKSTKIP